MPDYATVNWEYAPTVSPIFKGKHPYSCCHKKWGFNIFVGMASMGSILRPYIL